MRSLAVHKGTDAKQTMHSPKQQAVIQPKLMVNAPGDRYEQEADAMANKVMRMQGGQTSTGMIGKSVQRKCTKCEEEKKRDGRIMRKADNNVDQLRSSSFGSIGGNYIQRKCAHCEEEEKKKKSSTLMRKAESSSGGFEASSGLTSQLVSRHGSGSALPLSTKLFMENAFSTNFSHVRIHNDSSAVAMTKEVNAKAFTYGSDIYFNSGEYITESKEGKRLLAHELTHVVQQENRQWKIQKDDNDQAANDAEAKAEYNPENVIALFLDKLDEDVVITDPDADVDADLDAGVKADADTDSIFSTDAESNPEMDDALEWLGTGAEAFRKKLLVEIELMKLGGNSSYRQTVITNFFVGNDNGEELYLKDVKKNIDATSKGEAETLNSMNGSIIWEKKLDQNSFIDNWFIISKNAADAFPESSWNIVQPLVAPPGYMYEYLNNGFYQNQKSYFSDSGLISVDMSYNGLPVSYIPSLSLSAYSLIKSPSVPKISVMPTQEWMYQTFILPEEVNLHSDVFKQFTRDFISYADFKFQSDIYNKWNEAVKFKWLSFDTLSVSLFRQQYPTGFHNIGEFYEFANKGNGLALGSVLNSIFQGVKVGGMNPFFVLATQSEKARGSASVELTKFFSEAHKEFQISLTNAGDRIAHLSPNMRLTDAIQWSISKGFAEESITAVLENMGEILWNILKEFAKDKAVKKALSTAVGYFGPWGKAISIIYNVWQFFDDARDKIELALLVKSFVDILEEARSADSVIKLQNAAAKLAQAYETIFQTIIQKLGAKLLSKLSDAAAKKIQNRGNAKGKLPQAERAKLIDDTYHEDDARKIDPVHLKAEVETALDSTTTRSSEHDYDRVVSIGNSHDWKRIRGTNRWCRSSAKCTIGHLDPELEAALNRKADTEVPKGPADTEEMGQQLTDELGLSAPVDRKTINVSQSVADAIGGGFVSKTGQPLKVDLAVQFHRNATDVRDATGTTGKDFQSAHHMPSSVGNKLPDSAGYSRSGAVTVLLPPATHRAFDDYWKQEAIKLRQAGIPTVTVKAFREIMDEAIAQTPGITDRAKGAMRMVITSEFRDLGLDDTDMVELPYSNIR